MDLDNRPKRKGGGGGSRATRIDEFVLFGHRAEFLLPTRARAAIARLYIRILLFDGNYPLQSNYPLVTSWRECNRASACVCVFAGAAEGPGRG